MSAIYWKRVACVVDSVCKVDIRSRNSKAEMVMEGSDVVGATDGTDPHEGSDVVGAKWTRESGLLLVFNINFYLKVPRVAIQETIKRMPRDPLKHLINKRQWEMVFHCHCIQSPVIDTHPPTCSEACRDIFSLIILHHHDPRLLWHNLSRTHPWAI